MKNRECIMKNGNCHVGAMFSPAVSVMLSGARRAESKHLPKDAVTQFPSSGEEN